MTGRQPVPRIVNPARSGSDVRPIAPPSALFVSPPAIRRAVAGYAAEQAWATGVTAGAMREAMAVALAVAALVTQMPSAGGDPASTRTVPATYGTLQELTGLDRAGARNALETLAAAGVVRVGHDDAGLTLTLSAEGLWTPHPLLSCVPWAYLASALGRANAPLCAGLIVFAELALDTEAAWREQAVVNVATNSAEALPATPPNVWLEVTLKELARRVNYHLSHVENALAGLEEAQCLSRLRTSSGRAIRLAPWTIGAAPPPAALLEPAAVVVAEPEDSGRHALPDDRGIVVEYHGIRAVLAQGDTLDVSGRDAKGRRVLRIRTDDGDIVITPPTLKRQQRDT